MTYRMEEKGNNSIKTFFNTGLKMNFPIAIWRKPSEDKKHGIIQLSQKLIEFNKLETTPKGFVFSPFTSFKESYSTFMKADIEWDSVDEKFKSHHSSKELIRSFEKTYHELSTDQSFQFDKFLKKEPDVMDSKDAFIHLLDKVKDEIKSGRYQKIVASRRKKISLKANVHPTELFLNLCESYPNAFVSLVYVPNEGLWICATPELLLSIDDKNEFQTVSLAGTQSVAQDFDLTRAAWTQKEIEEQALVSRYIINCFKQIRLRQYEETGPKTVRAANLIHLKTIFKVKMKELGISDLGTSMLGLLHPTSAICGMPMLPSAKFLEQNEGYDREYYSGYLGPLNFENGTSLYVHLRCAQIFRSAGIIYAGAGVTESSDIESEWEETELKFKTLLNVIA